MMEPIFGFESFARYVIEAFETLNMRLGAIMSLLTDVQTLLQSVKNNQDQMVSNIGNIASDQERLLNKITELESKIAAGGAVSQAEMEALKAQATDLNDRSQALASASKNLADTVTEPPA